MNVGLHLKRAATWFPERTALVHEDVRLSFRVLNERVNRLANGLLALGMKKGDRVAVLSVNRHQVVEAIYACYKAGLVTVPLNARFSTSESATMLNHAQASTLIVGPEFVNPIETIRASIKTVENYVSISQGLQSMTDYGDLMDSSSSQEPNTTVDLDDLAELKYTSGTTGVLKAAMLSHRNVISKAKKHMLVPGMGIGRNSVICHVAPVTHASGGWVLPFLSRGGCNVVLQGFDEKNLLEAIERERVTHLFTVPTMLNVLMAYADIKKYDLSSIQTIVYGTSPMSVDRIKMALDLFGPVLIQGYGQTETSSGILFLSKEDHLMENDPKKTKRLASAGIPSFLCDVKVVNPEGKEVQMGEVGEIIEKGEDCMLGYWRDPELTKQHLRDGWVYTGDMARVDENGYIYIVDRKADMIITGGFNVYPTEVENVLYEHPAVFEAAVIGVPDDKWGEAVKALVVLKPGAFTTEEDLIEHCRGRLGGFKKPKTVEFVNELPKNNSGKILRRQIKEKFWSGQERMVH